MSTTPTGGPQTPAAMPPAKKSNALLWILGGCGTFIVLIILVFVGLFFYGMHKVKQAGLDPDLLKKNPPLAAAKMAVFANPDVEMVSSDDDAGTMVVKDKKTGKITTLKFDMAKKRMIVTDEKGKESTISADTDKGTMEIKTDDGTVKLGANADKPPDWVPIYPGTSPKSSMSMSDGKESSGTFGFTTSDSPDKVAGYYADQMKSTGLKVSSTTNTTDGKVTILVSGEDTNRTLVVTASNDSGGTNVGMVFHAKK